MEVGVLIDSLRVGGVEKVAILQARELSKHGIKVDLLVLRRGPIPFEVRDWIEGLDVIYLDDVLPWPVRFSCRIPGFSYLSSFHFSYPPAFHLWYPRLNIDVLLCHGTLTAFSGVSIANRLGCPVVTVIYDPLTFIWNRIYTIGWRAGVLSSLNRLVRSVDRWICGRSSGICTLSAQHFEWIKKLSAKSNVYLLLPGEYPRESPNVMRTDTFITASSWKRGKHLEELIEVFSRHSHLKLNVLGSWKDASYLEEIKDEIERLGVGDRICLLGAVSESSLRTAYSESLCAVIANEEIGFGMSVLEAAAQGCTFIAPDNCGGSRCFSHGEHGLFYRFGDIDGLEGSILTFAESPELAIKYGFAAWREVSEHLTWDQQAEMLESVLRNVLEADSSR